MVKKISKIFFMIVIMLSICCIYNVKADSALNIEKITQVHNKYNVQFEVINNNEVSATYKELGDTLNFNVVIKNTYQNDNVILSDITILTDEEGVTYSASLNEENLEMKPNETRIINVKGVLNNRALSGEKTVKIQVHYTISKSECTDCNRPIDVLINPKTGDNIHYSILILLLSLIILVVLLFIIAKRKRNAATTAILLIILLNIILIPIYNVKAKDEFTLELIIHQIIEITKTDDEISFVEVIKDYDGSEVDGNFDSIGKTTITPIYYSDSECNTPLDGKPINAGIYYATATTKGDGYYNQATLECSRVVTIEKAASTCPSVNNLTVIYDGEDHELTIGNEYSGGTLAYSLDEENWVNNNIKVKEPGNYTIHIKVVGDDNHSNKLCTSGSLIINKKHDTILFNPSTQTYSGNPIEPLLTDESNSDITTTYYSDSECNNPIEGKPINVGTYYLTATSEGNEYYDSASISCSRAITIEKADSVCPSITSVETNYDGLEHHIEIGEGIVGGILKYSLNNNEWTEEIINKIIPGEYSVYTKVEGDSNHNNKICETGTIKINKLDDVISVTESEVTYSGNPIEPEFSNLSNTTITSTYYNDSNCSNSINRKPVEPGVYYATAVSESSDIYNEGSLACTKAITISKKDDVITFNEITRTYDGETKEVIFENNSNTTITPTYYSDESCETPINGNPINAGIYYATATSEGNEYYNIGNLTCSKVLTIEKDNSICPTISNFEDYYDGNSHSLTVGSDISGGTLYYSLDNENWSTTAITRVDAGIDTIYTKVVGDNNHNDRDCGTNTVNVKKQGIIVITTDQSKTYDGEPLIATNDCSIFSDSTEYTATCINTGSITNVGEADKEIVSVTISDGNIDVTNNFDIATLKATLRVVASRTATLGECTNPTYTGQEQIIISDGTNITYSSNVGTNVGNYEITATSNNNYLFEDGSNKKNITCSINKITDSITFEEVESEYTGSNIIPVFSNLSNTTITKTYYSDSNCQSSIEGKPKNVGTYYVTASSEGNEIYTSASITCSKAVTITKADSTCPEIGNIEVYYDGDNHSLTIGSGTSGGTLYFSLNNGEWTTNEVSVSEVGTYNIKTKVVGDSNHKDKNCGENTIIINTIPKVDDVITMNEVETTYTGSPVEPTFESLSGLEVTPVYYSDNACNNSIDEKPTDAGVYYVTATTEGNDDYNSGELSCRKAVTINKANSVCPTISDVTTPYDENEHSLNIGNDIVGGTLYYSLNDGEWTKTKVKVTEIGTYNVKTKVVGDDNHNDVSCGTNTITINKKVDSITFNEIETTYTGNPVEVELINESNSTITKTYYSDSECTTEYNNDITDVGVYYVEASSEGNSTYTNANLTCTKAITINKADSVCPTINNTSVTYDGNSHSLTVGNDISGGTLYYSEDNDSWSTINISKINVGTYTIYTKVVGDNNHNDSTCGTNTITINQIDINVNTTNQSKTYDGEALDATNDCSLPSGYDDYSVTCVNSGTITNAGETSKVIETVTITKDSTDVTSNFNIIKNNGTLTIERARTASVGSCTNPTYDGTEQDIINEGTSVTYSVDSATNAGDYTIAATADPNYLYSDGSSVKSITCSIDKKDITITPVDQDITYGNEISKTIDDVVAEGLISGQTLYSIDLTQELNDVPSSSDDITYCTSNNSIDDSCKGIIPSNAVIYNDGNDVTNNYNITYQKGYLQIHYEVTFTNGTSCESYEDTIDLYQKELNISDYSIEPLNGYSAKGWKLGNTLIEDNEITVTGNNTYVSECVDDIPPYDINISPFGDDLTPLTGTEVIDYRDRTNEHVGYINFALYLNAHDDGSGVSKAEIYYRKCGTVNYTKLPDLTFNNLDFAANYIEVNSCLDYGDYFVYAVITDAAGNSTTTPEIVFTLDKPTPEYISIDGSKLGTSCNTVKCALDELIDLFGAPNPEEENDD